MVSVHVPPRVRAQNAACFRRLLQGRHGLVAAGLMHCQPLAYWFVMRITDQQQRELHTALRRRFGAAARLWLFGSRTDDHARGGDFDLMVQTSDADASRLVDAKLAFLADLHATPSFDGERVDVVLYAPVLDPQPRPIHQLALARGIELTAEPA